MTDTVPHISRSCGVVFQELVIHLVETLRYVTRRLIASGADNQSAPHPPMRLDNWDPFIVFSEVTPTYHNSGPECCLLSEERDPIRNKPQQMLLFSMFWGVPMIHWAPAPRHLRGHYPRHSCVV